MKIVLLSDIHANLPALKAAFQSIDAQNADAIYCLGDLVGYHIWPNEVIHEIRKRGIPTLAGNHDTKVKKLTAEQLNEPGKNFAYKIIGEAEKGYLASLPAHIRLSFESANGYIHLLLVHGSPLSNKEYLLADKEETSFLEVFKNAGAHILCFGHSHKPYHRILATPDNETTQYYHAINTGSIGKPKDGNAQGGYVVLTIDDNSSVLNKESIQVEFIRFDYDVAYAASAIENSPLPNEFADMLRGAF